MNTSNNKKLKQKELSILYKPIQKKLNGYKNNLRKSKTPAENMFYKELKRLKIKFQFQRIFYSMGLQCIVDFYFKSDNTKIVVEIDGGYHNIEAQQRKDEYRSNWLRANRHCKILRFTNDEIFSDIKKCTTILAEFYLNTMPRSSSKNHKVFSELLGRRPYIKGETSAILESPDWGEEEPLF